MNVTVKEPRYRCPIREGSAEQNDLSWYVLPVDQFSHLECKTITERQVYQDRIVPAPQERQDGIQAASSLFGNTNQLPCWLLFSELLLDRRTFVRVVPDVGDSH